MFNETVNEYWDRFVDWGSNLKNTISEYVEEQKEEIQQDFSRIPDPNQNPIQAGVEARLRAIPSDIGQVRRFVGERAEQNMRNEYELMKRYNDPYVSQFDNFDQYLQNKKNTTPFLQAITEQDEEGIAQINRNQQYIKELGLVPPEELKGRLMFMAGQAIPDFAGAIASYGLTGGSSLAKIAFGTKSFASMYQGAREQGATIDKATTMAIPAGVMEAVLEGYGLEQIFKNPAKSVIGKVVRGAIVEGFEEASQTFKDNFINYVGGYQQAGDLLENTLTSAFIGSIFGGGAGITIGTLNTNNLQNKLIEQGATVEEANLVAKEISDKISSKIDPKLDKAIARLKRTVNPLDIDTEADIDVAVSKFEDSLKSIVGEKSPIKLEFTEEVKGLLKQSISSLPAIQMKLDLAKKTYNPWKYVPPIDIAANRPSHTSTKGHKGSHIQNVLTKWNLAQTKPSDFFEQLGPSFVKHIYVPMHRANVQSITMERDLNKIWSKALKDNPTFSEFKTFDIDGRKLLPREMVVAAIQADNRFGRHRILMSKQLTEKQLDLAKAKVNSDPALLNVKNTILNIGKLAYPPIAKTYKLLTGNELGHQDFYLMMLSEKGYGSQSNLTFFENELNNGALDLKLQQTAVNDRTVIMKRLLNSRAPLDLNAHDVIDRFIRTASKYAYHAPVVHSVRSHVNAIKASLTEKISLPATEYMSEVIDDVLISSPPDVTTTKGAGSWMLRRGYELAFGSNPFKVALKQPASIINTYRWVKPEFMTQAAKDLIGPKGAVIAKDAFGKSAVLDTRYLSPEYKAVQEFKPEDAGKLRSTVAKAKNSWLGIIGAFDRPTALWAYHAAELQALSEGKTPAQAQEWAEYVVEKSQPSSHMIERNPLRRRGGFLGNTYAMFTTPIYNTWNNIRTEYSQFKEGKRSSTDLTKTVVNQAVLPAMWIGLVNSVFAAKFWAIMRLNSEELKEEEMTRLIASEMFNAYLGMSPLIGKLQGLITYSDGKLVSPTGEAVELMLDPVMKFKDDADLYKVVESTIKAGLASQGLNPNLPDRAILNIVRSIQGKDVYLGDWIANRGSIEKAIDEINKPVKRKTMAKRSKYGTTSAIEELIDWYQNN